MTGGIGSGKTTVAAIFETLGVPVSYADTEARRLMNEDPELKEAISRHFGVEAYAEGKLNRKWVAGQVFNDPPKLELLNSLVHPATIRDGARWMQEMTGRYPYAIREAAIIFETRAAGQLDFIIGVYAPLSLRLHRILGRDHSTREAVLQRMRNQIDEDIKMRLCDAVIRNDEQEAVIPQVLSLHQRLLTLASPAHP
ncbi:dephospho-CoA kinase [Puia dinghuensis]|uniref:Dephospho-CoA kinase n=1 Tax=Puia dinghuensis TaxID=1792502 RepID=A0A8J2XR78_9BACT|nr:dephospho-CoA kinase [Puia dinghuensis]